MPKALTLRHGIDTALIAERQQSLNDVVTLYQTALDQLRTLAPEGGNPLLDKAAQKVAALKTLSSGAAIAAERTHLPVWQSQLAQQLVDAVKQKICLAVFCGFVLIQGFIYSKTMKQFGEKDLFPFFLLLDVWMFFYYIIFAPSLLMKPKASWK